MSKICKYSSPLSPRQVERRAQSLAQQMKELVKQKEPGEIFHLDPHTPLSVLKRAVMIYVGDDFDDYTQFWGQIRFHEDIPYIWIRDRPAS